MLAKMETLKQRQLGIRRSGPTQRKIGKVGRPEKFHDVDIDKLIGDIARGVPVAIACAAVGIHKDTFNDWLDRKPEFARKLAAGKQEFIEEALNAIRNCGDKQKEFRNWAFLLERLYPEYYGPPQDKGFHFTQNNLMLGDLDEARRILDAAKALPYRSELGERTLEAT
jgi:hypothetical protein